MKSNAYLLTRLAVGATIFGHGLVRMPKIAAFAEGTASGFESTMLPVSVALPFGYLIVVAEFLIGLLLLFGLFTRRASFAGGLLMVLLILGTSLMENWGAIPSQLLHVAFLVVLIQFEESNCFALDRVTQTR